MQTQIDQDSVQHQIDQNGAQLSDHIDYKIDTKIDQNGAQLNFIQQHQNRAPLNQHHKHEHFRSKDAKGKYYQDEGQKGMRYSQVQDLGQKGPRQGKYYRKKKFRVFSKSDTKDTHYYVTKDKSTLQDCYFEKNRYGFLQKRVKEECLRVPPIETLRPIEMDNILNPNQLNPDGSQLYGFSTKYLAIDCEMDQFRPTYEEPVKAELPKIDSVMTDEPAGLPKKDQVRSTYDTSTQMMAGSLMMQSLTASNIPIKVSIINQEGQIVLDTLVRPSINGQDVEKISDYPSYRSLYKIHGVKKEWLSDAPTFEQVRAHISEICGKKEITSTEGGCADLLNYQRSFVPVSSQNFDANQHSIFIGHGVVYDLKSMSLGDVPYICTSKIDELCGQARKLKDLSSIHLNAEIQQGHHSSIIDSRCSLALFLLLRESYGLEMYGPHFLNSEEIMSSTMSRRRKRNKMCASEFMSVNVLDADTSSNQPSGFTNNHAYENQFQYSQSIQSDLGNVQAPYINHQLLQQQQVANPQNYAVEIEQMMRGMNMIECELVRLILNERGGSQKIKARNNYYQGSSSNPYYSSRPFSTQGVNSNPYYSSRPFSTQGVNPYQYCTTPAAYCSTPNSSTINPNRSYQMDVNLLKSAIEQVCDDVIREMLKAY